MIYGDFVDIDLSGMVAGIRIDPAIMITSGFLAYPGPMKEVEKQLGGVILKTVSVDERQGNETPIYCRAGPGTYINAVGLPGPGCRELAGELSEARPGIPLFASISGNNEEDLAEAARILEPHVDAFEANFSCPNIKPGETVGVTIGYDSDRIRTNVKAIKAVTGKPLFIKLPPGLYIFSSERFLKAAETSLRSGADGLSVTNTIPGGMKINIHAKRPVLSSGYGGVSGSGMKSIGIGCVYALREAFPKAPIIGIGGIEKAADIVEYVQAGADAVAMGSSLPPTTAEKQVFLEKLVSELSSTVRKLGYNSLMEMRGAAHER